MSQHNAKLFSPSLILASAALLIHISGATAADSKGDIPPPTPDAQELARQLLLGSHPSRGASTDPKSNAAGTAGETQTQKHPRAYGDAQGAAQELLLGQHHVSAPSSRSARATR